MSKSSGSVAGGDEIFIFTERVIKDDIKVRFFQVNNWIDTYQKVIKHIKKIFMIRNDK